MQVKSSTFWSNFLHNINLTALFTLNILTYGGLMMDKMDKIMAATDHYLERFGKALIGIYYLPPLADNWKFTVFMNSLLVTLRRLDLMPSYTWFMDAAGGHYLMLWLNGYFRNDLSEITPVVNRLWKIHSCTPIRWIDCIAAAPENRLQVHARLSQFLYSSGLNRAVIGNWHQRTYGNSRL